MKAKLFLICLLALFFTNSNGQLIQGTIKPGATANDIEIWLKPSFTNSTQYLFQIGMPIAFPASAASQPTGLTVTLDPGFTSSFGSNYSVTVNTVAHNTGNTEKYFNIVLVRSGAGASVAQNWTVGAEFKVLKATFTYASGATSFLAKLADYQDGGSDGLGNFYTQDGNNNYYITSNSVGNFYASSGNSVVGGTAAAGYAQLMAAVNAGTVSGSSPLCIGSTATYTSNGDAGGSWSSTNTSVATVGASTGLVTAVGAGNTNITYTISSVSAFKTLTVNAGSSSSFSASACGSYTLPWGGSVTTSGDYVHTYQNVTGCDSVVTAHVTINTVPTVAPITGTTTLSTGGTSQLSDVTGGGSWSSNNTAVATVNTTGLVTAVSAGSATISYKVTNGCGTTTVTTVVTIGQSLIQGTIKSGAGTNDIEVWLKPNFNNSTQYLFQIGMPIAWPTNASSQPTSLNVTLDPGFVAAFGNNYSVTVNTVAHNTGNTEKYFNIVLVRGGVGASNPQTWTAGTEFKVLTASFVPSSAPASLVKLVDYQDGGSDGQGNFYTQDGNNNYYITSNSIGNFYASPGQSTVGGNASAGYAQTIASRGCSASSSSFTAAACGSYTLPWGVAVTTSGDYVHTYQNVSGCDSMVTAHVTINNGTSSSFIAAVCNSYLLPWGGSVTTSGDYIHTYTGANGCDSVVTAHVTINHSASSSFTAAACGSYNLPWGSSVTTSGDYVHMYQTVNGCDSVVIAHVTINTSLSSSFIAAACGSYNLPWGGSVTTSGDYVHTYQAVSGCDSVVTAHVTINNGASSSFNAAACNSYLLPWGGSVTTSGDYTHTYQTINGCDSVVTAHVTINHSASSSFNAAACGSYNLPWGGFVTTSGDYVHTYQAVSGCDSVVTAHVTINTSLSSSFNAAACGSYNLPWGGSVTTSGDYVHTYQAVSGCDSVVTAHVTINNGASSSFIAAACNSYLLPWGGSVTTSGDYTHTYQTINGCDSVVTAHVTINHSASSSFNAAACGSYNLPWGGSVTTSGDYVHTYQTVSGCDSVVTAHVTINNATSSSFNAASCNTYTLPWGGAVTTSGDYVHTYQTVKGCDSVVTVHVTINHSTSSSFTATACGSYTLPWGGSVTTSGAYVHTYVGASGCDSVVTANVTINPLVSAGTVNGTSPLTVGGTATYSSTGTAGGTWSSSTITVATVNATSGLVTAVGVGTTNITYTVNSGCGSPVSSFKTLTVSTAANIAVNCPGNLTVNGTACSKSVATSNPTYSGPVVALLWSMSGATTGNSAATGINYVGTKTFNVGVTTVTYTVKSAAGSINTCSFTVTVTETTKPTIKCPSNVTQNAANGLCGKLIAVSNPTYSDNCSVASLTWVMSGATTGSSAATGINYVGTQLFNVGTTTITYTVKDGSGNIATGSFTVRVNDNEDPTIACPADISVKVSSGCSKSIAVPNPVYGDNCHVTTLVWAMIGATNAISPLSGINVIGTRNFNVGVTKVIYVITDGSGNFATSFFTVVVNDTIKPVISCPGNITQTAASGKCNKSVTIPNPVSSDNCSVDRLTWVMSGATSGSSLSYGINYVGTKTFNAGVTTITYTARDASGNTASCSFTVTISASSNCNVHTQSTSEGSTHVGVITQLLDVSCFPNPSNGYFNLRVETSSQQDVVISISDLTGRVIQQLKGSADQSFRFGDRFIPGTYMVEVRQGGERVIKKVVKY